MERQDTQKIQENEEKITTIKLSLRTKKRLDHLKRHPRSTYNETIEDLLEILNICRVSPMKARDILISLSKRNKDKWKE